ncbi:MAG: hypothetical protein JWR18_4161 [Segetibacter sp.]|jgi:hypothetical protein|nr:hypothetical protein [Segetibacter sp.]
MPLSNDNQDYGKSDEKNRQEKTLPKEGESKLTSDDLKGKQQVDADIENEADRPAEQQK